MQIGIIAINMCRIDISQDADLECPRTFFLFNLNCILLHVQVQINFQRFKPGTKVPVVRNYSHGSRILLTVGSQESGHLVSP